MRMKLRILIGGLIVLTLTAVFFADSFCRDENYGLNLKNKSSIIICGNTVQKIDKRLIVSCDGKELWASHEGWEVQDILAADLNGDGKDEVIFTLKKHGSFGKYKPLWAQDIKLIRSSHLFVYGFFGKDNSKFAPIWCSSAAKRPILNIKIASPVSLYTDGKNPERLLNKNKVYFEISDKADLLNIRDLRPLLNGKSEYYRKNLWYWDGFGFTLTGLQPYRQNIC